MFIITPQAARPARTPPCEALAHAPMIKMENFPYVDPRDQSVSPQPYALQKANVGANMYMTNM